MPLDIVEAIAVPVSLVCVAILCLTLVYTRGFHKPLFKKFFHTFLVAIAFFALIELADLYDLDGIEAFFQLCFALTLLIAIMHHLWAAMPLKPAEDNRGD